MEEKKKRSQEMEEEKSLDTTNVFVKFLPSSIDDIHLHHLFSPYGRIVSAKVMVDPRTWRSLGYGFVKFSTREEAHQAIVMMSGYKIDNKTLMCKLSNSFSFTAPSPNLYIKPLPSDITEDTLGKQFGEYGAVETVRVVRDPFKPNDAVGLERYVDVDSALNAIHCTHGTTLFPSWPPLTVRFAESEVQRAVRRASISPPSFRRQHSKNSDQFVSAAASQNGLVPSYKRDPFGLDSGYKHQFVFVAIPSPPVYLAFTAPVSPPESSSPIAGWYNSYDNVTYPSIY